MIENLKNHLNFLCGIQPARNSFNIESMNEVSLYIENYLTECAKKYLHEVKLQIYEFEYEKNIYKNVSIIFKGDSDKRIVVGAHYDVDGDMPGADDNGSAVSGLLELAELISISEVQFKNDIELVFYPNEEMPHFHTDSMGSFKHARLLKNNKTDVILMICYEMIGYYSDEANSQKFPLPQMEEKYGNVGNFLLILGSIEQSITTDVISKISIDSDLRVETIELPQDYELSKLSDHINYWKYDYPAVMFTDTAFLRNKNYHTKYDLPETLNLEKIKKCITYTFEILTKY